MRSEITNSEWVILRLLLNKSPLGSREIISILREQYQWEAATVKTFLSRLVTKKVIGYHQEKNAFFYYPLVSEMAYVRNETKAFFAKLYGDSIVHETEHFQFSGGESKAFALRLGDLLEANYARMSADFAYVPTRKQTVFIHASLKVMHSALGFDPGPRWMTAGWFWEILHIAPADAFVNPTAEKAVLHVYSQLIMHDVNPYAPFWVVEGIAVYEAGWLTPEQIKKTLQSYEQPFDAFTVSRLPTDFVRFREANGYELSITVFQFIVEKYGKAALLRFLKAPESLWQIVDCPEQEFWNRWVEYINENYLVGDRGKNQ